MICFDCGDDRDDVMWDDLYAAPLCPWCSDERSADDESGDDEEDCS